MEQNSSLEKILVSFSQIKKSFESIRLVYEYGDRDSALLLAHRTSSLFKQFIEDLRAQNEYNRNFIDMVVHNKMPHLNEDHAYFEKNRSQPLTDEQFFNEATLRLEKSIRIIEKEIKSMYPLDIGLNKWVHTYAKPLLFVCIVVLGIGGVVKLIDLIRSHNHGLVGEYFKDKDLVKFSRKRTDRVIDFAWGNGAPMKRFKNDNFSIRWTGSVKPPEAGVYEFITHSDDGVRLYIDDKLVIDNWTTHRLAVDRAEVDLSAQYHKIRLEYFDSRFSATIRLFWKYSAIGQPEIVKMKYLYPEEMSAEK